MKLLSSLSKQMVITMGLVLLAARLLTMAGTYLFYQALMTFYPEKISQTGANPSVWEWTLLVTLTILTMLPAAYVAILLSRRILHPINMVIDNLRQVAQGNLAARVKLAKQPHGETAELVNDFNSMAQRLELMAKERAYWQAAIAHELRTPLTILQGRLQGVVDGVFEPSEHLFKSLLVQVESLSYLVEDLRTLGLVESGNLRLDLEHVSIKEELQTVCDAFQNLLHKSGFNVVTQLASDRVTCDVVRIRQALMALLDNVRKYASPGTVLIEFYVDKEACHLKVSDSGPGLPPDAFETIFAAFKQHAVTVSRGEKGSGLGLSVVKAIAVAHQGAALCESSTLGGTSFSIVWPQHTDKKAPAR